MLKSYDSIPGAKAAATFGNRLPYRSPKTDRWDSTGVSNLIHYQVVTVWYLTIDQIFKRLRMIAFAYLLLYYWILRSPSRTRGVYRTTVPRQANPSHHRLSAEQKQAPHSDHHGGPRLTYMFAPDMVSENCQVSFPLLFII
jgi:hypothetical protein